MDRAISRLVTGKAKKYLRTSTALFLMAFLLLGGYLVFLENQYLQMRNDFLDNDAVRLITVTGPVNPQGEAYLKFADVDTIRKKIAEEYPDARPEISVKYSLGFGIPDDAGTARFLYGIDGQGARLLGLTDLEDDTLYTSSAPSNDRVTLSIPVVEVAAGGMSSGEDVSRTFAVVGGVSGASPLNMLGQPDPESLYVNVDTFGEIVGTAFGVPWPEFQQQYDSANVFGTQVIKNVYVYLPDLDDVQQIGKSMGGWGYASSYTLRAFDDIAGSLRTSALVGLAGIVAIFLGCAAYVLLTFNSYLRVSHSDLAILKHFGFTDSQVARMYASRAGAVFTLIGGVVAVCVTALGAFLLRPEFVRLTLMNLLVCGVLLGVLYAVVVVVVIRRHVATDVLTLLKADREFE